MYGDFLLILGVISFTRHDMNLRSIAIFIISTLIGIAAVAQSRTVRYGFADGLSSGIIGGAVQDRHGLLWFATWTGLHCYDGYRFHSVRIQPGDSASIGTDHIRDIILSDNGNIICHTDDDIYEFDLSDFAFKNIPDTAKAQFAASLGKTWKETIDCQGNRWSTDNNGLLKTFTAHHPAALISSTAWLHPRAFLVDRSGNLWIGTRTNSSVLCLAHRDSVVRKIQLPSAPYVLFESSNGDIWAGCKPGGLMKVGDHSIADDAIYDIDEDSCGRLWLATFGNGIRCCPDPTATSPTLSPPFESGKVRDILITPSQYIVAATTDGLLVGQIDSADYRNTHLRRIRRDGNRAGSLSSNATMKLARDSQGNIYIATESSGVDVIDERGLHADTPEFRHINTRTSPLTSNIVKAMALYSDTVMMIVGNDNVTMYNPASHTAVNLSRTFWADSCRFGEATPLHLADGSWIVGADEGAFIASAHNIYSRGYVPPLLFTTLAVNGGDERFCLVPRDSVRLDADSRNLTVGFVAVDYVDNSGILYRSRIDGSPWSAAGRSRTVALFNLTPGAHILEVQSTDRYGRWVDNLRCLHIDIAPKWHETILARILFGLLVIAAIAAVIAVWWHIRTLNRQRRELLEKYMALIGNTSQPDQPVAKQKPEDKAFMLRVRRYIEENIGNPDANIDDMARAAAASRSTLNRRLRSLMGVTAAQLLAEARMNQARRLISSSAGEPIPLADIAARCGYTDVQYFRRLLRSKGIVQ